MDTMCPLKYLTRTFGGKWKLPIICILADQTPKRYSVIKRRLGDITNMMLAQSLKELEAAAQWALREMEGEELTPCCDTCRTSL